MPDPTPTGDALDAATAAGPELDAHVLVALHGWWWARYRPTGRCALLPPVPAEWRVVRQWEPYPWGPEVWEPADGWPALADRLDEWDRVCTVWLAPHTWRTGMPSPSTDPRAMADVLAAIRAAGCYYTLTYGREGYTLAVWGGGRPSVYADGPDELPTCCRAALAWARGRGKGADHV